MAFKMRMEGSALAELELNEKIAAEKGPEAYQAFKEGIVEKAKSTETSKGIDSGIGSSDDGGGSSDSDDTPSDDSEDTSSDDGGGEGSEDLMADSPEIPEVDDGDADEDTDADTDDDANADAEPSEEEKLKQESFRTLSFIEEEPPQLRMEEFGFSGVSQTAWAGLKFIGDAFALVGLRFLPWLLASMFKVVLYGFAKVFKTLDSVFGYLSTSIQRFVNRTSKQKASIVALKTQLEALEKDGATLSTKDQEFDVRYLVTGVSKDLNRNLAEYTNFFDQHIMKLNKGLLGGFKSIEQIAANRYMHRGFDAMSVMPIVPSSFGFEKEYDGAPAGFENMQIYGMGLMIGNVELRARLDRNVYDTWAGYEKAYGNSMIFMAAHGHEGETKAKPMDIAELKEFLNNLELLTVVSLKHQLFYEEISKSRSGVINSVKQLFVRLAEEKVKVSFKDSVVLPLHLKSGFVSKVYMTGGLDLHDHTARVIANGLTFAAENIKLLRKQSQ